MIRKYGIHGIAAIVVTVVIDVSSDAAENYDLKKYQKSIDYSCKADLDCVIKDVHNCCGYYPKCVNKSAKTDPEYVREACKKQQMAGICGFPAITSCNCKENKCHGTGATTVIQ